VTDLDLIAKKLAFIETCIAELRNVANLDRLFSDIREQRFIEHTLQLAIQSAIDVASHVVSDERLGEPETNAALFTSLARAGWLDAELAQQLAKMAGFRNVLVHGYDVVDLAIVKDVVTLRLPDLEAFIAKVRARTSTLPSAR
jgi:uncharacterized protein YutE (UPF0331/DUF86 family)